MIILLIAIFYFMLIRPESKRKKDMQNLRDSLKVGDEVTTIGGVLGTICAVKDSSIVIETGADRVRLEITKWGISTKGAQTVENEKPGTPEPEKKDKKEKKLEKAEKSEDSEKKD